MISDSRFQGLSPIGSAGAFGAAALVAGLVFAAAAPAAMDGEQRPGPDILYWPLASSPQLENVSPWKAEPILVSGASAYRKGEFLYQDYLYDDYGAEGDGDGRINAASLARGTYLYPTDPKYARNAADFVELRLMPLAHATAIRITYNTMHDPAVVATTLALGSSGIAYEMPHGANARMPAKIFVTVHGATVDVVDAATGMLLTGVALSASVSLQRRQVDVRIPYALFDPRGKTVRFAAATGLWDVVNNRYLVPGLGEPTDSEPGGARTLIRPPAFFNVAFRYTEPSVGPDAQEVVEGTHSYWREQQQAEALAVGDLSRFFVAVDFRKLARQDNDDMLGQPQGVPETGFMSRIAVSHFESAQGRGNAPDLFPENCTDQQCVPDLAGRLQPYGLYVPMKPPPPSGYGLTIHLHGGGKNYNWLSDTQQFIQLGERGRGSIVIAPSGRGPSYHFYGQAGAAVFEASADVAARYPVDFNNVAISGISMGGGATYRFAALFPDLFVAAAPIVAPTNGPLYPIQTFFFFPLIPSYRHVSIFSWTALADEYDPHPNARVFADELTARGYRHEFLSGAASHNDGLLAAIADFSLVADWLGDRRVIRDPAHVTYVFHAYMSEPYVGVNADHAYWISGLELRDDTVVPRIGTVDVFSHGFGLGDPHPLPMSISEGVLMTTPPFAYVRESHELDVASPVLIQNRLDITVRNIRRLTIDPTRARVNCDAALNVDTDGYVEITLSGCDNRIFR